MSDFAKDTNVPINDLISRQAVIYAFYLQSDDDGWWCGTVEGIETLLKSLPSEHSEIIMCKDCSHWKTLIMDVHKCGVLNWLTDAYDYCSFCAKERRQ